jgi:hypothetical protein
MFGDWGWSEHKNVYNLASFNIWLWVGFGANLKKPMQLVQRCCLVMGLGGPIKKEATKHKCAKTLIMLQCTNVNQGN